jgi:hypothetical protein
MVNYLNILGFWDVVQHGYIPHYEHFNIKVNNASNDSLKCMSFHFGTIYIKYSDYLHLTNKLFILNIQTHYYNDNTTI